MLGERLQYLRLEKGMTQKELSKVFKVSLKTIQFYEQNRTIPDIYLKWLNFLMFHVIIF